MYRYNQPFRRPYNAFWGVVAGVLFLVAVFSVWVAWQCSAPSLVRVYDEFNHVHVFEDGSFTGQLRDGRPVNGCIPNAKCED